MPYVPSLKTDGKSIDRQQIDVQVELAAHKIAEDAKTNFGLLATYKNLFALISSNLISLHDGYESVPVTNGNGCRDFHPLAVVIWNLGQQYGYEGAFLGELNYAITRLIQRVPQIKVEIGQWQAKDELRYWLYAITVQALIYVSDYNAYNTLGIGGVFEDIKDEYKRRVNTSYEAAQIVKSGDCYDTPYYTRLVEVTDPSGKPVGHVEIMLKRSPETVNVDVLPLKLVLMPKWYGIGTGDSSYYQKEPEQVDVAKN
jgi:hypothetical protein